MISKDELIGIVEDELRNSRSDYIIDILEQRGYSYTQIAEMLGCTIDRWFIVVWPDEQITEQRIKEVQKEYSDVLKYWEIEIIGYKEMAFVRATKRSVLYIDDIESELLRETIDDADAYDRQRDDTLSDNQ